MKTKTLLAILIVALVVSLTACGGNLPDKPFHNGKSEVSAQPTETAEPVGTPDPVETPEPEDEGDSGDYHNTVYYVGEDVPSGSYVIHCTSTDYGMDVIVFAGAEDYENFLNAEKYTIGEFSDAVEFFAWSDFYMEQDEKAYVGLRDGYIILLDGGQCEFNKYDPSASETVFPGVYVVGEDIDAGKINIKCTSDYLQVTLFEDIDQYLGYHQSSRFTIGEESDAIEMFAVSSDFIGAGDSTYANLQDGMIMMVEDGTGEYSADEGPIIN